MLSPPQADEASQHRSLVDSRCVIVMDSSPAKERRIRMTFLGVFEMASIEDLRRERWPS